MTHGKFEQNQRTTAFNPNHKHLASRFPGGCVDPEPVLRSTTFPKLLCRLRRTGGNDSERGGH